MHHYLIECEVVSAYGRQTWEINAENESEALTLHKQGKSAFVDEEVLVDGLGDTEIVLDD